MTWQTHSTEYLHKLLSFFHCVTVLDNSCCWSRRSSERIVHRTPDRMGVPLLDPFVPSSLRLPHWHIRVWQDRTVRGTSDNDTKTSSTYIYIILLNVEGIRLTYKIQIKNRRILLRHDMVMISMRDQEKKIIKLNRLLIQIVHWVGFCMKFSFIIYKDTGKVITLVNKVLPKYTFHTYPSLSLSTLSSITYHT